MKNILFAMLSALLVCSMLISCGAETKDEKVPSTESTQDSVTTTENEPKETGETKEMPSNTPVQKTKAEHQFILGKWDGNLRNKKLTILIESIQGDQVTGFNIAGKNRRPLTGKIMDDDRNAEGDCMGYQQSYKLVLNEPGDDKWDGTFIIYFGDCPQYDEEQEKILSHYYSAFGSWKAYSGKLSGDVTLSK